MNIAIIGSGHVGLVTGACFADLGNDVICIDNDLKKIRMLNRGQTPIYEPGLVELVKKNSKQGRLRFSASIKDAVKFAKVIFICVGTPPRENGEADLSTVEHVAEEIAKHLTEYRLIVEKSTVPVETGIQLEKTIRENNRRKIPFDVASNPEFLREGSAVYDFFNPDRIVIGVESERAEKLLHEIYKPFQVPVITTDIRSSELIKHASNSFLAAKISFINMVSQVCAKVGADIVKVAEGLGADRRIGKSFLHAGIGFGGFCFPKDLSAFIHIAEKLGVSADFLRSVLDINEAQKSIFLETIEKALWNLHGKTVGVLGLSFKPDTDDMRFAPSVDIIKRLLASGVKVNAYDPRAMAEAKSLLKGVTFCETAYAACRRVDAVLVLTEWREFRELNLKKLKKIVRKPIIIDGRNLYDPTEMKKFGFQYHSIGRK